MMLYCLSYNIIFVSIKMPKRRILKRRMKRRAINKAQGAPNSAMSKLEYEQRMMDPRFRAAMIGMNGVNGLNLNQEVSNKLMDMDKKIAHKQQQLDDAEKYKMRQYDLKSIEDKLKAQKDENKRLAQQMELQEKEHKQNIELKDKEHEKRINELKEEHQKLVQPLTEAVNNSRQTYDLIKQKFMNKEEISRLTADYLLKDERLKHLVDVQPIKDAIDTLTQQQAKIEQQQKDTTEMRKLSNQLEALQHNIMALNIKQPLIDEISKLTDEFARKVNEGKLNGDVQALERKIDDLKTNMILEQRKQGKVDEQYLKEMNEKSIELSQLQNEHKITKKFKALYDEGLDTIDNMLELLYSTDPEARKTGKYTRNSFINEQGDFFVPDDFNDKLNERYAKLQQQSSSLKQEEMLLKLSANQHKENQQKMIDNSMLKYTLGGNDKSTVDELRDIVNKKSADIYKTTKELENIHDVLRNNEMNKDKAQRTLKQYHDTYYKPDAETKNFYTYIVDSVISDENKRANPDIETYHKISKASKEVYNDMLKFANNKNIQFSYNEELPEGVTSIVPVQQLFTEANSSLAELEAAQGREKQYRNFAVNIYNAATYPINPETRTPISPRKDKTGLNMANTPAFTHRAFPTNKSSALHLGEDAFEAAGGYDLPIFDGREQHNGYYKGDVTE